MLRLGRAAVFGSPDAESSNDVIVEVSDGKGSHGRLLLRMLSTHTYR